MDLKDEELVETAREARGITVEASYEERYQGGLTEKTAKGESAARIVLTVCGAVSKERQVGGQEHRLLESSELPQPNPKEVDRVRASQLKRKRGV